MALEALRGDPTIQEIAAKHQVHPNQVSTWKRRAVECMADVFPRAGKAEGPMEPEVKELHAKIGRLAVENFFVSRAQAMRPANKKALIRRDHPELSIRQQCRPVRLSRSSFYYLAVGIGAARLELKKAIDKAYHPIPVLRGHAKSRPTCAGKPGPLQYGL